MKSKIRVSIVSFALVFCLSLSFAQEAWMSKYDKVNPIGNSEFYQIEDNLKFGIANKTGKVVLPISFDQIGRFVPSGFATISSNFKTGLIDKNYKIVILPTYDQITFLAGSNLIKITKNYKHGFYDLNQKKVVQKPTFDEISIR